MNVDPQVIIKQRPAGSALPCVSTIDGGSSEVTFLIREDSVRIKAMAGPLFEFRLAVFEEGKVALVPLLVRIGEEKQENIFEMWLNFYAEDFCMRAFKMLATQPRMAFFFYGDGGKMERSMECVNSWGPAFETAAKVIMRRGQSWSMTEFDQAREKIYEKYPSVWELWQAIAPSEK